MTSSQLNLISRECLYLNWAECVMCKFMESGDVANCLIRWRNEELWKYRNRRIEVPRPGSRTCFINRVPGWKQRNFLLQTETHGQQIEIPVNSVTIRWADQGWRGRGQLQVYHRPIVLIRLNYFNWSYFKRLQKRGVYDLKQTCTYKFTWLVKDYVRDNLFSK